MNNVQNIQIQGVTVLRCFLIVTLQAYHSSVAFQVCSQAFQEIQLLHCLLEVREFLMELLQDDFVPFHRFSPSGELMDEMEGLHRFLADHEGHFPLLRRKEKASKNGKKMFLAECG